MPRIVLAIVALIAGAACLCAGRAAAQPPTPPATQPQAQAPAGHGRVSDLIVKDVKEVPGFLFGSARTTLTTMPQVLGRTFSPIPAKARENHVALSGPAIFVYHGCTGDPVQPFSLDTGFVVEPGTPDLGELKVKKLPAFRAATAYYTGPVAGLGEAFGKLFAQLGAAGYTPTDETREIYYLWEGPESPNNVVELQVGIGP
jgi:effector-binding domain-containing protein